LRGTKVNKILNVIDEKEIKMIHQATLKILKETGVRFYHSKAVEVLYSNGCKIENDKMTVKFPEELIMDSIKKAPGEIKLCGREERNDLVLKQGSVVYCSGAESPKVVDINTGKIRDSTLDDFISFARINDYCENVDIVEPGVAPQDIPKEIAENIMGRYNFANTTKHMRGGPIGKRTVRCHVRMAQEIAGGEEELKKRPIITLVVCNTPPLAWGKEAIETGIEAVKAGVPIHSSAETLGGATSPITIAGSVVQENAEILAYITFIQCLKAAHPVFGGNLPCTLDMKTTLASLGSIEVALNGAALSNLYSYYNIPVSCCASSDSLFFDQQAGFEKALTISIIAKSGAASMGVLSGMLEAINLASYEQCIIDNEILGIVNRFLKGLTVNEETLAVDTIQKVVGHGGNFLGEMHTLKNLKEEIYLTEIFRRSSPSAIEKKDYLTNYQLANKKAKEIIKTHSCAKLDDKLEKRLDEILVEEKKKLNIDWNYDN